MAMSVAPQGLQGVVRGPLLVLLCATLSLLPACCARGTPLLRPERFVLPSNCTAYLDGNSLGPLSHSAVRRVQEAVEQWAALGIDAWEKASFAEASEGEAAAGDGVASDSSWFTLAESLSPALSRLVGALPSEVIATGTITDNLYRLLATYYAGKGHILTTALDFPTDAHVAQGWAARHQRSVRRVPAAEDGVTLNEKDIEEALRDPTVELAILPTVVYRSGQLLDVRHLSQVAREQGVFLIWDAAHSVGIVPHSFHDDVDAAVWCNYKYLGGGPGSPAALFVNERHHVNASQETAVGMPGWWGGRKETQFLMALEHDPAHGAAAFQTGTPCILGLAALKGALEVYDDVDLPALRKESLRLTDYLAAQVKQKLPEMTIETPMSLRHSSPRSLSWFRSREPARGGHVAIQHPLALSMSRMLRADHGVVADFRPPHTLRLCPHPLYTSTAQVDRAIAAMRQLLDAPVDTLEEQWESGNSTSLVT